MGYIVAVRPKMLELFHYDKATHSLHITMKVETAFIYHGRVEAWQDINNYFIELFKLLQWVKRKHSK